MVPASTATAETTLRSSLGATTLTTKTSTAAEPTASEAAPAKNATDKPAVKAGIAVGAIIGVVLLGAIGWLVYKKFFSGSRWKTEKRREPQPSTERLGPLTTEDPYVPGNPSNLMLNVPSPGPTQPSHGFFNADAPYGNDYERNAPSRGPLANSTPTIGSGTLHGGYGGRSAGVERPLSIVSDVEDVRYVRPRASELEVGYER